MLKRPVIAVLLLLLDPGVVAAIQDFVPLSCNANLVLVPRGRGSLMLELCFPPASLSIVALVSSWTTQVPCWN